MEVVIDRSIARFRPRKKPVDPRSRPAVLGRACLWLVSATMMMTAGWIYGMLWPSVSTRSGDAFAIASFGAAMVVGTFAIVTARGEPALKFSAWLGSAIFYIGLFIRFAAMAGSRALDIPEIH
jgi:hypothetical protein